MESKLTLKLDSGSINKAKRYIENHKGFSLSKLVENYFNSLTKEENEAASEILPPIVSSLAGIAKKHRANNTIEEYTEYLVEKFK